MPLETPSGVLNAYPLFNLPNPRPMEHETECRLGSYAYRLPPITMTLITAAAWPGDSGAGQEVWEFGLSKTTTELLMALINCESNINIEKYYAIIHLFISLSACKCENSVTINNGSL